MSRHKGNNTQVVSLQNRTCECGKFQGTKMPCSHAIAACLHVNIDMWRYVDKCYKLSEALNCYSIEYFKLLVNKDYWPQYDGVKLVPDMRLMRKKGRPKTV